MQIECAAHDVRTCAHHPAFHWTRCASRLARDPTRGNQSPRYPLRDEQFVRRAIRAASDSCGEQFVRRAIRQERSEMAQTGREPKSCSELHLERGNARIAWMAGPSNVAADRATRENGNAV